MTPVYAAASALDAQLLMDLLEDAGIHAEVVSAGAVGQVEVQVGEADAEAARALVRHLESGAGEIDDGLDDGDDDFAIESVVLEDDDEDLLLDSTSLDDD